MKKILLIVFITSSIFTIFYIIGYLINNNIEKKRNKEIIEIAKNIQINKEEITNKITETMLRLKKMKIENSDIMGWIKIEGTNIDYPVLQCKNNEFYLTHNYKKEYSKMGGIFLDKDVEINKPSTNFLIYGHRSETGEMFEDLIKYKKEEFYRKHPLIQFTTLEEDAKYEIIAVFLSKVYYKKEENVFRYYYFINANNENEFDEYIQKSIEESLYNTGKIGQYGEQILTLSTCEYSRKNGRLVIVAKKI